MRTLLMAPALLLFFLPTLGHAASLRCGTELVTDGDSQSEVLLKCGEPMAKQTHTEWIETRTRDPASGTSTKQGIQITVEEWTYNFGPNRFMQVVVFKNGTLVDVKSTDRGR